MNQWIFLAAFLGCASTVLAQEQVVKQWDTYSDTWAATDALGRSLPTHEEVGPPKPGKTVAMFYFLWTNEPGAPIYDLSKLIAANPADPAYGPRTAFHWWGRPWFGYYVATDASVIRKHLQMCNDAGVDVLVFDNTNGPTYPEAYTAIFKVAEQMRKAGMKTPQFAFFAGHGAWDTVYRDLYAKGLYADLWFRWAGKPLLMAHLEEKDALPQEVRDFFTVRESWAWTGPGGWFGDGRDKWPWLDNVPQKAGWHVSPEKPEEISVSVAQHPTGNIGRSHHDGKQPAVDEFYNSADRAKGIYFADQWRRALEVNPAVVFVTGWNEWIAQRFISEGGGTFAGRPSAAPHTFFVDQFSPEFSRDIEPVTGGFEDNYYYQLIANVRRFKGVRPLPAVISKPVSTSGNFAEWAEVRPEFRDDLGDPVNRDSPGWGEEHYVNNTGRNDIVVSKASIDAGTVHFYARTAAPLTPASDANWMMLFIDADGDPSTGWLGYDFVLNHVPSQNGKLVLHRNVGGKYEWAAPVEVPFTMAGNELEVAIPRSVLGITALPATVDFKWADNIQQTGHVSDFTLNGDAAPNDRFNYRAKFVLAAR